MSEVPDLVAVSDLLQDLSVQLRRLNVRQDGESRLSPEPGWVDVPSDFRGTDPGPGANRAGVRGGGLTSLNSVRQQGVVSEGSPNGRGNRAVASYKAAVQGPATHYVTPVSRRVAVMAGVGGDGAAAAFAVGPIQAQVAACANVDAFDALYAGNAHAPARRAMEGFGMVHPDAGVRLSATQKRQTHQEQEIRNLQAGLAAANAAANNAAAAANAAQAVAQAAGNADRFRPANPPKYGNKEKDPDVRQWLSVVEDYLRTCPDNDYLRLASSYLEGGPRMLWQSRYEAYRAGRAALADPEPPIPRQFFRQTLEANYGLADQEQKHWDAWNSLRMTSGMEFTEYVVHFQQALTDLADHVQDEQIKIEKFRDGLIPSLKEITRTSPAGGRWADLQALITYTGLQWPQVKERMQRRKSVPAPAQKVAGKRRGGGGGTGATKKGRLGAASESSKASGKDAKEKPRLCFVCKSPDHMASTCPQRKGKKARSGGKVAAVQPDVMDEDFA